MHNMRDTATLAQAILAHHAATFAGFSAEPVPAPSSQEPVYLAALQACSTLGFIARRQGQDRGRAAVLLDLGGQGFQRRSVFIGQQVGAIAQCRAAQGLESSPDA